MQENEVKPQAEKKKYDTVITATGRRKVASARVRLLSPGTGVMVVNKRPVAKYFLRETDLITLSQPLKLTKTGDKLDIIVSVAGGGTTGQAEAMRHGIARALVKMDISHKKAIKKAGYLTRDARVKERKKYGRKRARRRFQFSKR